MLRLIPARLHRAFLPLGFLLRKTYLHVRRPQVRGVCVFIEDEKGRVLLIRQSYGTRAWTVPAGGAKPAEAPEPAIRREMREELGCELEALELLCAVDDLLHGAPHRVWVFRARAVSEPSPDLREVVEVRWFALEDLPDRLTRTARQGLQLLEQR